MCRLRQVGRPRGAGLEHPGKLCFAMEADIPVANPGVFNTMNLAQIKGVLQENFPANTTPRVQNTMQETTITRTQGNNLPTTQRDETSILARYPFLESVTEKYQALAVNFVRELMAEYDCQTSSEKAVARVAAAAYARAFDYSEEMRNCRAIEWHGGATNGYFSMISKEVDRANRQFMAAMTTLKQMKAPGLQVNVTAKNAFLAGNQQFNTSEIIKPK